MFTGLFQTSLERVENVIINVSATAFLGMLFIKVLGLADITWFHVAAPVVLPIVTVVGLIVLFKLLVKVGLFIYNTGEKLMAAFHGIFR